MLCCVCSRFSQLTGGAAVAGSAGSQLPGYGQQSVGLGRQSGAGGVNATYLQQRQLAAMQRQQQQQQQQQQQMAQQNPLMHRQMSASVQQQQQQQNNQFASYPPYR